MQTTLNVAKMTISLLDREENTVGKEENAVYIPSFSPFPTAFSKALFVSIIKGRNCGKELTQVFTK